MFENLTILPIDRKNIITRTESGRGKINSPKKGTERATHKVEITSAVLMMIAYICVFR